VEYATFYRMTRILAVSVLLGTFPFVIQAQGKEHTVEHSTVYCTVQVDGLSIFYREAGPKDAPTLLLLHGLPSSSRMFEPLYARLRSLSSRRARLSGLRAHRVAKPKKICLYLDHIAEIMNHFTEALGISHLHAVHAGITAAPWVSAWCWSIRSESKR
jgi:hypothetical protein